MTIPLYGFVEGDTMGLLVLAHADMPVAEVIARLSDAASTRVDPAGRWQLMARDRVLPDDKTVRELGLDAFERIDLRRIPHGAGGA